MVDMTNVSGDVFNKILLFNNCRLYLSHSQRHEKFHRAMKRTLTKDPK